MSKALKNLLDEQIRRGATLSQGRHLKLRLANGRLVTISRTASDRRAIKNIEADIRRHS